MNPPSTHPLQPAWIFPKLICAITCWGFSKYWLVRTTVGVSQCRPLKVTSIVFQIIHLLVFYLPDRRGNETKKVEYWKCLLWFWRSFATEVNKRPLELLLQVQLCCNQWPWGTSFRFSSPVSGKGTAVQQSKASVLLGCRVDGSCLRPRERKMSGQDRRGNQEMIEDRV